MNDNVQNSTSRPDSYRLSSRMVGVAIRYEPLRAMPWGRYDAAPEPTLNTRNLHHQTQSSQQQSNQQGVPQP